MTKEEKLNKIIHDFSLLPDEKQDHILGVLQSLAFAHDMTSISHNCEEPFNSRSVDDKK
jgi:hypothetical protein